MTYDIVKFSLSSKLGPIFFPSGVNSISYVRIDLSKYREYVISFSHGIRLSRYD